MPVAVGGGDILRGVALAAVPEHAEQSHPQRRRYHVPTDLSRPQGSSGPRRRTQRRSRLVAQHHVPSIHNVGNVSGHGSVGADTVLVHELDQFVLLQERGGACGQGREAGGCYRKGEALAEVDAADVVVAVVASGSSVAPPSALVGGSRGRGRGPDVAEYPSARPREAHIVHLHVLHLETVWRRSRPAAPSTIAVRASASATGKEIQRRHVPRKFQLVPQTPQERPTHEIVHPPRRPSPHVLPTRRFQRSDGRMIPPIRTPPRRPTVVPVFGPQQMSGGTSPFGMTGMFVQRMTDVESAGIVLRGFGTGVRYETGTVEFFGDVHDLLGGHSHRLRAGGE
mmetsp:Transcript_38747/g.116409  ORF Transcript_38747/g.116409 Transcript_38747/m.116409 type:complete len:339 (+) Transcript_38747:264-1280(+)